MAQALESEVKKWLKNDDENTQAIEVSKISGNDIVLAMQGELKFTITVEGNGKFKVSSKDMQEEWLQEMKEYLAQGKKTIADVLTKATDVFTNLALDEEGEEENEEEEEENDMLIDAGDIGGADVFAPIVPQAASTSYDPELEKAKEKFNLSSANQAAVSRLMKDYMQICKSDTVKFGYTAEPVGDNLFKWHIKMLGFNKKDSEEKTIAEHLEKYAKSHHQDHMLFEMTFPPGYPFEPPFIRLLTPRLEQYTGHVTIGGSICMELLTKSGWRPSNSIESIIVQIRAQLIEGKAKIDFGNTTPYTEAEAKEAYFRVLTRYGWDK